MKNEQRKKEDCQLLDAYHARFKEEHYSKSALEYLKQFKADNDLLPTKKSGWYKDSDGKSIWYHDYDNDKTYGISSLGKWCLNETVIHCIDDRIATTEEATERLSKIATEMGFVEGVEVKYLQHDTNTYIIQKGDSFHFGGSDMTRFNIGLITIMKDGKWAKILPSENKIKKLEEKERRLANKLENTRKKLNELKGE